MRTAPTWSMASPWLVAVAPTLTAERDRTSWSCRAGSSAMGSPASRRRTSRSLAALLRKFRKVRTTACGAAARARAARPSWATTTSVFAGIWFTGEWITWTSRPAFLIRFLSWFAPMRLEPMPASQAKTTR